MNGGSDALTLLLQVGVTILLLAVVLVRLRARARRRPASTLPAFLRHFEAQGVPVEVAASVFRQLQRWMEAQDRHYPVRPDQDLAGVYGLVPEEVEGALARLAGECGRRFDPDAPRPPLASVADLVTALARCPEETA
ncbi:MAG: hypothetical protein ACQGVC_00650 [Myxococcota bacterium]